MLSPAVLRSEWTVLKCRLASALNAVPRESFHLLVLGMSADILCLNLSTFLENPLSSSRAGAGAQIYKQACRLAVRGGQYPRALQTDTRGGVASIALSKRGYYREYPMLIHPVPTVK